MEYEAFKLTKKQNLRLPPKRGQVLKKISKDLKKMEYEAFKLTKKQNLRLPPKRGQVLKKILKDLFGSAGGKGRRNGLGGGGGLTSSSSTPDETPSGYNSDAASESGFLIKLSTLISV